MSTKIKKEVLERLKHPNEFAVVLFNDDKTLFDFVVDLIIKVFNKSAKDALFLTHEINTKGEASINKYPKSVAEMKLIEALSIARNSNQPLTGEIREVKNDD